MSECKYPARALLDGRGCQMDDCPRCNWPEPEIREFFLTFFLLDADRPNPRFDLADPGGYVIIQASSATEAHTVARSLFGRNYHDIYGPDNDFPTELYPRGELLRIVVPAGLVEQEDHRV